MRNVVFLDVDGVVNDLIDIGRPHKVIQSHGYTVRIPENILNAIRHLVRANDVHWLTTWRERANDDIAPALGIPSLKVITDGTTDRYPGWKWEACLPVAREALQDGRHIYWIEDFYGEYRWHVAPEVFEDERFHYVDTWGCATPSHLYGI